MNIALRCAFRGLPLISLHWRCLSWSLSECIRWLRLGRGGFVGLFPLLSFAASGIPGHPRGLPCGDGWEAEESERGRDEGETEDEEEEEKEDDEEEKEGEVEEDEGGARGRERGEEDEDEDEEEDQYRIEWDRASLRGASARALLARVS